MKKVLIPLLCCLSISLSLFGQTMSVDELIDKGNQQFDHGDYENAIRSYNAALAIDNNSDRANYEIANTYFATKNYREAINYADKVIKMNSNLSKAAYITKGSALDVAGKPEAALQVYQEGLKKYPDNYLLQYNTALTYFNQKQDKQAENHAVKAIEINVHHASSHILLSQCMLYEGKRVQGIMGIFYFLMLENNTQRSEGLFKQLQQQLEKGVSKEGEKNINITMSKPDDSDEFRAVDLMLSMDQALKYDDKNKGKTEEELFYDEVKSFFDILIELKSKGTSSNIWWDTYVPFFDALKKSGNTETYCYYIAATSKDGKAAQWLTNHKGKVDKLLSWFKAYK